MACPAAFLAWSLTGSETSSSSLHTSLLCPGPQSCLSPAQPYQPVLYDIPTSGDPPGGHRLNKDHPEGLFLPRVRFRRGQSLVFPSVASFCIGFKDSRLPSPRLFTFLSSVFSASLAFPFSPSRGCIQPAFSRGSPGFLVPLAPCPVSLSTLCSFLLSSPPSRFPFNTSVSNLSAQRRLFETKSSPHPQNLAQKTLDEPFSPAPHFPLVLLKPNRSLKSTLHTKPFSAKLHQETPPPRSWLEGPDV